ncbi:hypothetical protein T484DRAFT_1921959, partial [Baffinella frigidus]
MVGRGEVWEAVMRGQMDRLSPDQDLSPHLPLLARVARAHSLRPSEAGPFASLAEMLEAYPESARCMEYAQLDWAAVLAPVRDELVAASKGAVEDQRGAMFAMEVDATGGNDASDLGVGMVAAFERADPAGRMTLTLRELAGLLRVAHPGGAPPPVDRHHLLAKPVMQEEVRLMLPLAVVRCRALLPLEKLLPALARVDRNFVLLRALANNTPGLAQRAIPL